MKLERLARLLVSLLLLAGFGGGIHWILSDRVAVLPASPYSVVREAGVGPPAVSNGPDVRSVPDDETRSEERIPLAVEPRERRSVVGRVAFPAGAPFDDSLAVVALGEELARDDRSDDRPTAGDRSWQRREVLARAPVAANGTFRLELPIDIGPQLDIDGAFLFLPEPLPLDPAVLEDEPLVLSPELGGAIRGTLELPPGATEVPGAVTVGGMGSQFNGAGTMRMVELEDTLEFELRALPPGVLFSLWADFDIYPSVVQRKRLRVEAGQRTELRIPLSLGATVRGQVVSPCGAPIAGAEVSGDAGASFAKSPGAGRARSDEHGRFVLRGLVARPQALTARAEEYLDEETEELELVDGAVHDDLRIVMSNGLELSGTVRWPDGAAVSGARLTVIPLGSNRGAWRMYEKAGSAEGSARSSEKGEFRIGGLEPGAYGVYAECAARGPSSEARPPWNARIGSIEAGTTDVVLTLAASVSFAGVVLDDVGGAVDAFTVTALRVDWTGWTEGPSKKVAESFTEAAGAFVLGGLDAGEWSVSIRADGYLSIDPRPVTVRTDSRGSAGATDSSVDLERFELTRTARVAGLVLDPTGRPVAGAEVRAMAERSSGLSEVTKTDDAGRFALPSVGPGPIALSAASDDWAPSLVESIELQPGDERTAQTVHLTQGGALSGLVLDALGAPDSLRTIAIQSKDGAVLEVQSDTNGRFRAEHLAPGPYQVIATPDAEAWMTGDEDGPDLGDLFEDLRIAAVSIVDGETVDVVLGMPPRAPVEVRGRVLRAGRPVAGANVLVLAENGPMLEGMRGDTAGEDGRFEVKLDEPGDYTFAIMDEHRFNTEVDFQVTIPEIERHEVILELPGGSIEGHVRTADGSPLESGYVWMRREDAISELSVLMGKGGIAVQDDGSFRIETLHSGRYALSATGPGHGITTLHDVVVSEGDGPTRVELTLVESGRVTGVVTDEAGAGVADAIVFLRDEVGRPLFQLESTTDRDGGFVIDRVPAGDVFVCARAGNRVSVDAAAEPVQAGQDTRVELGLRAGVMLRLSFLGDDGASLRAAVRVENEAGHDFAGCMSHAEIEDLAAEGLSSTERRVGPLPPGRYTLRATAPDGRAAVETVTLSPQSSESVVSLRLHG